MKALHAVAHAVRNGIVAGVIALALSPGAWAQATTQNYDLGNAPSGPIRLRQPVPPITGTATDRTQLDAQQQDAPDKALPRPAYRPGEFERFVQRLANAVPTQPADADRLQERADSERERISTRVEIRRFGAELMIASLEEVGNVDYSPLVPPDYLLSAGDELVVTLWGSVDADVRLTIDRSGRITVPRVGPVMVAGVRYGDAADVIRRRVAQVFRNFDLSVSLGQVRGVRVYVTGFIERPGAYNVSSLSTVTNALLRAGGPTAAGSFRQIQLRRGTQPPVTLDLYDFVLSGDRSGDRLLQAGDVIHVGPVGPQVGLIGSINKPAVFELKGKETIGDVLRMAGGFTAVADRSRVAVERLDERNTVRIAQLPLPQSAELPLNSGDVLRAFSAVEAVLPVQQQNKRVRVEGEVQRPGEYVLPAATTLRDAINAAGGLTSSAYLFGVEFTRESVRITQQENYDRALRDLETQLTRTATTQRATTADEAAAQTARASATTRLVERLRLIKPTGRIVLEMPPDAQELPSLALEDSDRLYIPPRPTTVGVFGSVFNAGSYLFSEGRGLEDYLNLAGGPTKGADKGSSFVIRANGSVVSARQRGTWLTDGSLSGSKAEPGDTIFVPEELNKTTFIQNVKDWTQILYQFGLGVAAIKTLRQ